MKRSGHRLHLELCDLSGESVGYVLSVLAGCRQRAKTATALTRLLDLEVAFMNHFASMYQEAA